MNRAFVPPYIKFVFLSLLIIIIVFFMVMAKKILIPLMISGYVAMLLTSFCNRLEKRKIPRSLAAFIALLIASIFLIGFLYFVVTQVGNFADDVEANMEANLNSLVSGADSWIQKNTGFDIQMERGFELKKMFSLVQSEDKALTDFLFKALGTLSDIILLPVFIFFLLIYRDHFAVFVSKVFRSQKDSDLLQQIAELRKVVHNYLIGAGKVMLILGIVNTGVLFALGIKHAIFFGMLAGALNIIPYLGPALGAILPFLFALLTKDNLFYPAAVVVSFTLIQFLESAYLTPRITGANVSLNAFVTFLGLLIGGMIWGIPGMILIIPTIAILKKLFELSPETEPYAYLFGEEDHRWFRKRKT
ncbi:AI-2E family transporter [Flavobacterium selenitireducens]|uniref:AI-2E family transporter n=1 Tax=Flavobacterium selenitireducens TaxID=2722704 RepID=UPI00168B91D7|nr:AI-2E family transporter [Flavobacterium selenitireducens]MBD3581776.1 AI-2E family transporter [Flavobacterium selenitireducens]